MYMPGEYVTHQNEKSQISSKFFDNSKGIASFLWVNVPDRHSWKEPSQWDGSFKHPKHTFKTDELENISNVKLKKCFA